MITGIAKCSSWHRLESLQLLTLTISQIRCSTVIYAAICGTDREELSPGLSHLITQGRWEMLLQPGQIKIQIGKLSTKYTIRLKSSLPGDEAGAENA